MSTDNNRRGDRIVTAVRKRRTEASRRPKPDYSPLSTSTPSDDENGINQNRRRKEVNVNQFVNRVYSGSKIEASKVKESFLAKRSSEGVLAPANWKNGDLKNEAYYSERNFDNGRSSDASVNESKVKKVKLKVGGVTRTIQANSTANDSKPESKVYVEENQFSCSMSAGLQGLPWKSFSKSGASIGAKDSSGTIATKSSSSREGIKSAPARKSKRVSKKSSLDGEFGEDYEDDEIRYLEKLKGPKLVTEGLMKDDSLRKLAKVGALKVKEGRKRSTEDFGSDDVDQLESETDSVIVKKQKKERDSPIESSRGIALTSRQRALQSSKDGSSASGANLIEFPNGLPHAPPRKQKEKLSEMEQQLKKAEAAERRRIQNEKAARESEAEAIRKILGQDSGRKKREDKIKKRQEVLAQEKTANSLTVAPNTVRWVMGPSGTVVTFPSDMNLSNIFNSKPLSYPPPREICAGPSCSNPYKYRDSKSKLPLCSLQCYKAVQVQALTKTTC